MKASFLSYRQKNRLLLSGSLLFCVIVYVLPIRQTLDLYAANQILQRQLEAAHNAPATIQMLEQQVMTYNLALKNFSHDTLRREEYLLDRITNTCKRNRVTLVSLPTSQRYVQDDFEVETRLIKARGGFLDLLRVVYDLEFNQTVGRISSVRFAREEDHQHQVSSLFATVYIQNLRAIKNESR